MLFSIETFLSLKLLVLLITAFREQKNNLLLQFGVLFVCVLLLLFHLFHYEKDDFLYKKTKKNPKLPPETHLHCCCEDRTN